MDHFTVRFIICSICWAACAQPVFADKADFSPAAFFSANLDKVEAKLREQHVQCERSKDSVRFLDTLDEDKGSALFGRTVEVFGNLTMRFTGNGRSGWAILEPTGKGAEVKPHAFLTDTPALDEALLGRIHKFEMVVGHGIALTNAYLFRFSRITSPTSLDLTGGLLAVSEKNGLKLSQVSAQEIVSFDKSEEKVVKDGIGALIFSQTVRTTGQAMIDARDLQNKTGNYSWMRDAPGGRW